MEAIARQQHRQAETISAEAKRESNQPDQSREGDSGSLLSDDDAPASPGLLQSDVKRGAFKRIAFATCVSVGLLAVLAGVGYFWLLNGGRGDMSYQVRNPQSPANSSSGIDSTQGITEEEIAREMKKPSAANNASDTSRIATAGAQETRHSDSPITNRLPEDNFSATVNPNAATMPQPSTTSNTANGTGQSAAGTNAATGNAEATQATKDSHPNSERSIRVQLLQAESAGNTSNSPISTLQNLPADNGRSNATVAPTESATGSNTVNSSTVPVPPLGTMSPVRTLGTVFTLRSDSFVRMQLTRDVAGRGWQFALFLQKRKEMNNLPDKHNRSPQSRLRFTYILLALSLGLFVIALAYSAWAKNREHDANLPVPALEAVVVALRTFHRQTGRFPKDFRELDARLWKKTRQAQISSDGTSLVAPASHYYYTLHTINPPQGARAAERVKAALWAVPTGARASEAATYFWYVTPDNIECWMGPALTQESIGTIKTIPSEQQLTLLVMIKQGSTATVTNQSSRGIFSIFGF